MSPHAILRPVRVPLDLVRRNRFVITLFVLMVLLPAAIFGALMMRAVGSERIQADYYTAERQQLIVRLVESDLNKWLFSTNPGSAVEKALLTFRLEGDRIIFPDAELSLPSTTSGMRRPLDSASRLDRMTREVIAQQYYPRVQAFLRDLEAGRNSGAQFFLRLRAVIVRLPLRNEGYVLDAEPLIAYVNARLKDFCATEAFSASVRGRDFRSDVPAPANRHVALGLEGFPFFEIVFAESDTPRPASFRQHAFAYSMGGLFFVTILGTLFLYRAVAHEARLSRLRTDFIAAVSHEFRSPLSSILALSERLSAARVHDAAKLAQYHSVIDQEARRLSQLVARLLNFAQIEEGKKVYALERLDLASVVRDAVQGSRHAGGGPARIHLQGCEAATRWINADRTALEHAIQNVIENALKYSSPESPVSVMCTSTDGFHVVEVRDRGIGIPEADQRKIFDKFYRGSQASELNSQGIGIGLALVKHVIDGHGGSILLESRPGEGSCFRLLLPKQEG